MALDYTKNSTQWALSNIHASITSGIYQNKPYLGQNIAL